MSKTLSLISIKGGVGKTTIASSIAADLVNSYKKKVLIIDANYSAPNLGLHMDIIDPEKTIHHVLDNKIRINSAIQNKFGVDIIPGSYVYNRSINFLKLKDKLNHIKKRYDFVILDSSPSLNDEVLSAIIASDTIFVVTTPDFPTLSCSLKAAKLAKQRGKPIAGIIINKIRDPKFEISMEYIEEAAEIPVVAKILDDKTTIRSLHYRIPQTIYNNKKPFSKEINRLCAALTFNQEKKTIFERLFSKSYKRERVNREILKESFYKSIFKE